MNTKVADTAIASSVQRIASAGTILAASQIAGMILQVFMFSLIQHRLSHADNGTLFWIQQTSALAFLLFTEMGINSVVTRLYVAYYTEPHVQERVITTFLIVRFGLWLLTSLGLCAFAIITEPTIIEYVALYLIYSGIAARGALLRMVFELRRRASNRITLPALASLLDLILTCSALMLMRDQLSLATVIIAFALGSVPGFVIMLLSDKQWHSISIVYFDVRIMHMIFRDTAPIFASICMMQLQDKCDTIILNTYFGREALGVFAAIMRVILPCISLLMIIANVVAPPVTQLYATEPQQAHKLAISGLRWTLVASSGCAVFIG
ncbi:MAG: oligosaccharide flippase family protein, partial [Bacteroidota bacterium]|nr:oligosaccharide flippase family protein [Candidatus Kapabacteria bacterium]MDW8221113.1 oligosaccharide flippase family protein [Bacteroidota bacterium]